MAVGHRFQSHAATIRSWASSDEYANAASMASFLSEGYSVRMDSMDISAAKQSRTTDTIILVP